jgi:uncharacterized membrane protein
MLAILGVFAVAVRILVVNARGIWIDEAFTLYIARLPWREAVDQLRQIDPHPPLFYVLLRLWNRLGTDLTTVRGFSVFWGTLTVLATALLGIRVGGRTVGLSAGSLVAASALAIQTSVEARMYPLLSFLVVAATAFLIEAVRHPSSALRWGGYGLCTALAAYVDYFAWLVVAGHAAYVVLAERRSRVVRVGFLLAVLAAVVAFVPWLPATAEQLARGHFVTAWKGAMPAHAPLNMVALTGFGGYLIGLGGYLFPPSRNSVWQAILISPFLALIWLGALRRNDDGQAEGVLLVCTWTVPVLLLIGASIVSGTYYAIPRYTGFLVPFFSLLVARGLLRLRPRRFEHTGVIGVGLLIVLNLGILRASVADPRYRIFDWAGAASHVESHWQDGDALVFYPAAGRVAFGYHFRRPVTNAVTLSTAWNPEIDRDRWASTLPDVPVLLRSAPRVWLVLTMPVARPAVEALLAGLGREYRPVEERSFQQVWVILFSRRTE